MKRILSIILSYIISVVVLTQVSTRVLFAEKCPRAIARPFLSKIEGATLAADELGIPQWLKSIFGLPDHRNIIDEVKPEHSIYLLGDCTIDKYDYPKTRVYGCAIISLAIFVDRIPCQSQPSDIRTKFVLLGGGHNINLNQSKERIDIEIELLKNVVLDRFPNASFGYVHPLVISEIAKSHGDSQDDWHLNSEGLAILARFLPPKL